MAGSTERNSLDQTTPDSSIESAPFPLGWPAGIAREALALGKLGGAGAGAAGKD